MSTNLSVSNKVLFGISLIAASLLMLFVSSPARAETFTVTNTDDFGPGTLRQAVTDANNTAGADNIQFSGVSGTITLTSDTLTITDPGGVTIDGGNASITIRGGASILGDRRVFRNLALSPLDLRNLTIAGGIAPSGDGGGSDTGGGGILNYGGTLTVTNCTFSGNQAPKGSGGGIYNTSGAELGAPGMVTVTDSTFSGNSAKQAGGAIFTDGKQGGTVTVSNTTFSGNSADLGGGIYNSGTTNVTDSTVSGNTATIKGGGVYNSFGHTVVEHSTITDNTAKEAGGAIFNARSTVTLTDSTISDNKATDPTGNTSASGGGIDNAGTLTVTNSTFSGNSAIGGFSLGGGISTSDGAQSSNVSVTTVNSTFSGNSASDGGGIFSDDKTKLTNSTFSDNSVGGSEGAAITVGPDQSSQVDLENTIVANTTDSGTAEPRSNCKGTLTDDGYNIDDDGSCVDETVSTSRTAHPLLDPRGLRDNGGPTETIALEDDSPAIDAIPSDTNSCGTVIATDQRGVERPQDSDGNGAKGCDIGALEVPEPPPNPAVTTSEDTSRTLILTDTVFFGADSLNFFITQSPSHGTLGPLGGVTCTATFPTTCSVEVTYTPDPDYNGFDFFTFKASDGFVETAGAGAFITVRPINDAPSFDVQDNPPAVDEDAGAQTVNNFATNMLAGPENESDQTVSFDVTNDNDSLFASGGQPAISSDGTLTYTPAANANGSAEVSVRARDNGGTANGGVNTSVVKTFTITLNAVNDAPANTVPGNQGTDEDTALTFNSANNNPISISDIDSGSNAVKVTLGVSHGKLTLGGTGGLNFATGDGSADPTIVFTGTIADINSVLSGLKFDPDPNFNGSDVLSITTDDQGSTGSGGALGDTDTVNITVNSVNDAPTVDVAAGGSCDTSAKGTIKLMVGDADTSVGLLTLRSTSSNLANVSFGGSGTNRTLTVSAAPKRSGTATVTVTVSDGQTTSSTLVTVIVGTDSTEKLVGTEGADIIFGKNGNDTIDALGGNDLLCGGNGVGTMSGGIGDDTIDGANGDDVLLGGIGKDILRGGFGNDRLTGGDEADFFSGGAGTDTATDFNAAAGDTKDATIP